MGKFWVLFTVSEVKFWMFSGDLGIQQGRNGKSVFCSKAFAISGIISIPLGSSIDSLVPRLLN